MSEILTKEYDEARSLLVDNRDALDRIAESLLERETLEGSQLQTLLRGEPLPALTSVDEAAEDAAVAKGPRDEREKGRADGKAGGTIPDPEPMPS